MSNYPQLMWLEAQGATFVKLSKGKKTPFEKNWQASPRTLADIIPHIETGGNIGLLCGAPSGGIVALDLDQNFPDFLTAFPMLADAPRIIRADAPERGKVLVKIIGKIPTAKKWKPIPTEPPRAEFLSTGNQALVPPSIHPSGTPFQLINTDLLIPEIPLTELDQYWREWTAESLLEPTTIAPAPPPAVAPRTLNDAKAEIKQRFDMVRYACQKLNAQAKTEGDQVRILGQGGLIIHPEKGIFTTFTANKTGGDCFDLVAFLEYGRTKVKGDEWRNTLAIAAHFAGVTLPEKPAPQKNTVPDSVRYDAWTGDEYAPPPPPPLPGEQEAPAAIAIRSAWDILNTKFEEPNWAIPGLLPPGLTLLAGRQKLGKSWLAMQLAYGVALGGMVLDKQVSAGGVLYLALEDNWIRLQKRMKQQQWELPTYTKCDFMTLREFTNTIGDLRNGGGKRLAAAIEEHQYRLVVVDTLSRAVWGNQSDVDEMTRWLSPIQALAFDTQSAILIIDHHAKSLGGNNDPIADILGSSAKAAVADCIWGLYRERGKPTANLVISGRDVEDQQLSLRWDGPIGTWIYEGDTETVQMNRQRVAICDAIRDGAYTHAKIAEATGMDKGNLSRLLAEMVFERRLAVEGDGRGKRYALANQYLSTIANDTDEDDFTDEVEF
jgi:archaellum biogenesis ATPase FlaH